MDNDVEEELYMLFGGDSYARVYAKIAIDAGYRKTKKEGLVPLDLDKLTHHINIFIKHETHHNKLTFDLLAQTRLSESICSRFSTPKILEMVEVCGECFCGEIPKKYEMGMMNCPTCQGRGIILKGRLT